jgi:hypothetical protein
MLNYGTLAKVKGNELDCYNWEEDDLLLILELKHILDVKHHFYAYQSFNFNKNEFGVIDTCQFIVIVDEIGVLN